MTKTDTGFPVLRAFFSALAVFFLLRLAFAAYHHDLFEQTGFLEFARSFVKGTMIDSSMAAIALFAIRLFSFSIGFISNTTARWVHTILLYLIFAVYFFINLLDIFYFEEFDSRLNILLLENIGQMTPIIQSSIEDYPILPISIIWIMSVVAFAFLNRLQLRFKIHFPLMRYAGVSFVISMTVLTLFSFLWIGRPFRRILPFSSSKQALNQLSLNGVYTLAKAVERKRMLEEKAQGIMYDFRPVDKAIESVRSRIIGSNEEFVPGKYPMVRKILTPRSLAVTRPNIVMILMEGFSASYIGVLNEGKYDLSPGFDELCRDGILFTNLYGHETRTHHGLVSAVGSFPSLLGMFITRNLGQESIHTMGNLLRDYGYRTSFIYGYKKRFASMGSFMKQGGFRRIIDSARFVSPRFRGRWGVSDEDLFDKAHQFFTSLPPNKPFFSVLLTSSNHTPRDIVPYFQERYPEYTGSKEHVAFAYSDFALKKFMDTARTAPYFENTIFIITSDHGEIRDPDDRFFKRFHIPCLIYAPHLIDSALIVKTIGGQVDIATTLMHLIGYPKPFHFVGRNLLAIPEDDGFAIMRNNDLMYYRSGNTVLVRDIRDTLSTIHAVDSLSRMLPDTLIVDDSLKYRMNRELEDYLQTLYYLVSTGTHRTYLTRPK